MPAHLGVHDQRLGGRIPYTAIALRTCHGQHPAGDQCIRCRHAPAPSRRGRAHRHSPYSYRLWCRLKALIENEHRAQTTPIAVYARRAALAAARPHAHRSPRPPPAHFDARPTLSPRPCPHCRLRPCPLGMRQLGVYYRGSWLWAGPSYYLA